MSSGVCPIGAATAAAYSSGVYDEALFYCLSSNWQDDTSASLNTEAIFQQQGPRKLNDDESVIANTREKVKGVHMVLWDNKRISSSTKYMALSECPSEEDSVGICRTRKKGNAIHVHVPLWDSRRLASATKYMALPGCLFAENSVNQSFVKEQEEEVPRTKDFTRVATLVRLLRQRKSTNMTGERTSSDLTITLGPSGSFDTSAGTPVGSDHERLPTPNLPAQSTRSSSMLANSPSVRKILLEDEDTFECSSLSCPFDWTCPRTLVQDERGGTMQMVYFEEGDTS